MLKSLQNIKLFLIDFDGTIYLGNKLINGADKFVEHLQHNNINFCFLTNNNSRSRNYYVSKLDKLGIKVSKDNIYTSGMATVEYLNKNHFGKKAYLMGTKLLQKEFKKSGITLDSTNPDVVVVAYDTELTYAKLDGACHFIRQGLPYIATHPDLNCPTEYGFAPDVGSYISLIKTSTGRNPDVIIGKPNKPMADAILGKFDCKPKDIAMIGDRLMTDIAFGNNNKITSVLVLSGETTEAMHDSSDIKAKVVINSVKNIID